MRWLARRLLEVTFALAHDWRQQLVAVLAGVAGLISWFLLFGYLFNYGVVPLALLRFYLLISTVGAVFAYWASRLHATAPAVSAIGYAAPFIGFGLFGFMVGATAYETFLAVWLPAIIAMSSALAGGILATTTGNGKGA